MNLRELISLPLLNITGITVFKNLSLLHVLNYYNIRKFFLCSHRLSRPPNLNFFIATYVESF